MNEEALAHPPHWKKNLGERADLELSFRELYGYSHFFTDALRARIRYYQMRYDESWDLLDRAAHGADQAPSDVPNLIRRFFVSVFSFYTALAERPLSSEGELPNLQMPAVPPEVFDTYPELRQVIIAREAAEALLRLHAGQPGEAVAIFRDHIATDGGTVKGNSAYNYVGLAAGLQALGNTDDALRNLENAGYVIRITGPTLTQARVAALLNGFYHYLDEGKTAQEWLEFLYSLPCPTATKELFEQRAARVLERCTTRGRLLPL